MRRSRKILFALICFNLLSVESMAAPAHHLGASYVFHSGKETESLTGSSGYSFYLRAEDRKDFFRPYAQFDYLLSKGTASIGVNEPAYKLYGGSFSMGLLLYFFEEARILPFVGAAGVAGYYTLRMESAPTGIEPYTQSPGFGWEGMAGADLRLGSKDGNTLRLSAVLWNVTASSLANGMDISGWKIGIGIGFYK